MSHKYRYTGNSYKNFEGNGYSSANHITVAIDTPSPLAAGLSLDDPLPEGTKLSLGDGGSGGLMPYRDLSLGENPASPPFDGGVAVEARLSTDSAGRIVSWKISLDDDTYIEGLPITTSFQIDSSNAPPDTPVDRSQTFVDPTPGLVAQGSTDSPGEWTNS